MLKIAYSPVYRYALPAGHRFPMIKYELIPEQLLYEGTVSEDQFFSPERLDEADILAVHTSEYWEKLKEQKLSHKEERKIGFPMTPALVDRGRFISKGTIECALFAMDHGVSMNVAGGTHHAYAGHGEGFCVFNDFAIAARYLLDRQIVKKILIVDLDVHQGNGTAHIFRNEPGVFTFSMHGKKNYPHRKELSDLDIELEDGTQDCEYLKILESNLPRLIDTEEPEFIFYLSGVDILASDRLGRISMTHDGVKKRDIFVFETAKKNKIPVAVSMGGGYSPRIADIIEAHANTFRAATQVYF
jgi:acetoin utilization deacetylase AcuC-like enzyme